MVVDSFKINVNKNKSGEPYESKNGKKIPAKKPKPVDCSTCFYKCKDNFTEETGDQICYEYIISVL